jgi:hypothetical protein
MGKEKKKGPAVYCVRFGQIAVELGFLTDEQLKDALCEQVDDDLAKRRHRLLGDICIERGWMTSEQVKITLRKKTKSQEIT